MSQSFASGSEISAVGARVVQETGLLTRSTHQRGANTFQLMQLVGFWAQIKMDSNTPLHFFLSGFCTKTLREETDECQPEVKRQRVSQSELRLLSGVVVGILVWARSS